MERALEHFFTQARRVNLTSEERLEIRNSLENTCFGVRIASPERLLFCMKTLDQFFATARTVTLTPEERTNVLEQIRRQAGMSSVPDVRSWADVLMFLTGRLRLIPVTAAVLIVVLGLGGSVSYAAESALPGDVLYSVKVRFTEPLREQFAFGRRERAEVSMRHARKRLEEAEALLVRGDLSAEAATGLSENLQKHTTRLEESIALLEHEGGIDDAEEVRTEFIAAVRAHDDVLRSVITKRRRLRREVAKLLGPLQGWTTLTDVSVGTSMAMMALPSEGTSSISLALDADHRLNADEGEALPPEKRPGDAARAIKVERILTALQRRTDEVGLLVGKQEDTQDAVASATLEKMDMAKSALADAKSALKRGDLDRAQYQRRNSLEHLEEATVMMQLAPILVAVEEEEQLRLRTEEVNRAFARAEKKLKDARASLERLAPRMRPEAFAETAAALARSEKALKEEARPLMDAQKFDEAQELLESIQKNILRALQEATESVKRFEERLEDVEETVPLP